MSNTFTSVAKLIAEADKIVIGAGAGLSTAAGLRYDGPDFEETFKDFIAKYHFTDLYTSSFYRFATREEFWATWALHIDMIRFRPSAMPLYRRLFDLVKDKDYFVITTNVDGQFRKSGFDSKRLFEVQGDYAYLQCSKACHDRLYYNKDIVEKMIAGTTDCSILSELIPFCPVCGEEMMVHVRVDNYFVENKDWNEMMNRYSGFIDSLKGKNVLLLELGVGYNTPTIIRYPFEQLCHQNDNIRMLRINPTDTHAAFSGNPRLMTLTENIEEII